MDGARLANACVALNATFKELTVDCGIDVLSFGGTKNGLMLGESVIVFNDALKAEARYIRKQSAQLASKLRYLSCQFTAYLTDELWKKNATHAKLNLSLREAAQTHKQILTVNGKTVRITIPAGVTNGQVIKLRGYGAEGVNGGPAGDLYITFTIADDLLFKRLGDDLYINVSIDLYTAILGGEQLIDTLNGKVKLKVKPETQNGTKVRLKGKGFPVYKKEGQFGDLIVEYSVKLPTNLTEQQKEMFRKLQSMNSKY